MAKQTRFIHLMMIVCIFDKMTTVRNRAARLIMLKGKIVNIILLNQSTD